MNKKVITIFISLISCLTVVAQDFPTALPKMWVTGDELMDAETTFYNGNAPMTARFEAQPQNVGDYQPVYEWTWRHNGVKKPILKRFDENTTYEFNESGTFDVTLTIRFIKTGSDTIIFEMDSPFRISIAESQLEVPNAFTPNGDGINDILKVKEGYKSIIDFKATVFNRWGRKLYEWKDIKDGWNGKFKGNEAPDGAYYLHIQARGADGRKYHIRKTISLLRRFDETNHTGS